MQVLLFSVAPSLNKQTGAETHRQLFVPHGAVEEESELKVSVPGMLPSVVPPLPSAGGLPIDPRLRVGSPVTVPPSSPVDPPFSLPVSEVVVGVAVVVPVSEVVNPVGQDVQSEVVSMKHPGGLEEDETKVASLYKYKPMRVAAVLQEESSTIDDRPMTMGVLQLELTRRL
jgi:hypothetical protein